VPANPNILIREISVAKIPTVLHDHINGAYPENVVQIATVLPNGFAQVTLRGSVVVYDDEHFGLWERGLGSTNENLADGSKVTVFFRKMAIRETLLPKGGVARFYGIAEIHKSGPVYDGVWEKMVQVERDRDPEKKGYAVLIKVDRAEDFSGDPLKLD
jgi:hypothetical protein